MSATRNGVLIVVADDLRAALARIEGVPACELSDLTGSPSAEALVRVESRISHEGDLVVHLLAGDLLHALADDATGRSRPGAGASGV